MSQEKDTIILNQISTNLFTLQRLYWILFVQVNRVAVYGGTLDAKGAGFWACRKSGKNCPVGARVRYLICIYNKCDYYIIVLFNSNVDMSIELNNKYDSNKFPNKFL
jgi:hypothetical protein